MSTEIEFTIPKFYESGWYFIQIVNQDTFEFGVLVKNIKTNETHEYWDGHHYAHPKDRELLAMYKEYLEERHKTWSSILAHILRN